MWTRLFGGSPTQPPIFLPLRSSRPFIILTVSTAVFTDIFAYGIVVPVFPFALTTRASIPPEDVQKWISIFLAVYGAALLVSSPVFGWLGDRNESRQIPFLGGLIALGGSTVMLCVGNSIAVFMAGRVLQGVSAAVVWCAGLALLVDTVGPEEIGTAMGYVGLSMSLAVLVAPVLGGVVFERAGYYAVFGMVFGLIGVDVVLRLAMIEPRNARKWAVAEEEEEGEGEEVAEGECVVQEKAVEGDGIVQVKAGGGGGGGGGSESPECSEAKDMDLSLPPTTAEINLSNAVEASPEAADTPPTSLQKFTTRLPPIISLFGSRRILCALFACTMQASLLTSFDSILPLFVRDTFSWNATGAGLIFLPLVAASFIGPWIGALSDKYGPRWFATAGFILACPFLILLRLVDSSTFPHKIMLCAFLVLVGLGLTLAIIPIMAEMAYAVEAKAARSPPGYFGKNGAYAQAYGLFNMAWAAGSMIGPLVAGLVREAEGWGTVTLVLGCVSVVTSVPTAVWTGGSIFKERRREREEREGE